MWVRVISRSWWWTRRPGVLQFMGLQRVRHNWVTELNWTEMFFWYSLAFLMIQQMLAIWSLVPLPFLKPAWTSGSSQFSYCWSLAWRIFEHYLSSMWNECNCMVVWTFFGFALLWDWNENWSFVVPWPLFSFPNLMMYWVQYLNSIIF